MQKKAVFVSMFILLIAFKICIPQTTPIYENTSKGSQTVKFIPSVKSESDNISNYFITKVAEDVSKPAQSASYTLFFNEYIKVTQSSPYEYDLSVEIKNYAPVGDYKYRGINIYDALIPSKVNLNINISGRTGNESKPVSIRQVSLTRNKNFVSDK
ncbi:MAG: hypothetical protein PHD97_12560, partial [Bacteroidales bacterium]|nr:hypothetical protein [Bacteroidales bacterium]